MAWVKLCNEGWQSPIAKFFSAEQQKQIVETVQAKQGDLILFAAGNFSLVCNVLSVLRQAVANKKKLMKKDDFRFCWIVDFPLFEYSEEEKRLTSVHHPFTMPNPEDWEIYHKEDPLKIKSCTYDLVLNGEEIGGGGMRIYKKELQQQVFEKLGIGEEAKGKFAFLLAALEYGAPPHGGIALGMDRIMGKNYISFFRRFNIRLSKKNLALERKNRRNGKKYFTTNRPTAFVCCNFYYTGYSRCFFDFTVA